MIDMSKVQTYNASPSIADDSEGEDQSEEENDPEMTTKAKLDRYRHLARQFIDEATTEI